MNIGYHAVYDKNYLDALKYAAKNGFDFVQFDLAVPNFYLEKLTASDIKKIRNFSKKSGVGITLHAPGDNLSLFIDYQHINEGILKYFKFILRVANQLNARRLVIHPLDYRTYRRSDTLKSDYAKNHHNLLFKTFERSLNFLIKNCGQVMICVENCSMPKVAQEVLQKLFNQKKSIYLSLDIAKLHNPNLTIKKDIKKFFVRNRKQIREIHLHDQTKKGVSHLRMGQGNINFSKFFPKYLNKSTDVTIEVRPRDEALRTKKLFKKNYLN